MGANKYVGYGRFQYQNHRLHCENIPLAHLAQSYGTPLYVYSRAAILENAHAYLAQAPAGSLVCYAVKANGNPAILRLLAEAGLGADVTSGGELFLALHAGFLPEKIIYSGVGKLPHEIEAALDANIRALHVESARELEQIALIASQRQQIVPIGVRVNPDIYVETHPYISTGARQHKFGVSPETAVSLFHFATQHPWLKPVGIAAHIGSQIQEIAPFTASAEFLVGLADELASSGIQLEYIDVGGGLGVQYASKKWEAQSEKIEQWMTGVAKPVQNAGYRLVMEPGRSIVAAAGALLTQVVYTKSQGGKQFAIVDAAMNDLLRPTLYKAHHEILPVDLTQRRRGAEKYDVVGPICETGDFLGKERPLPSLSPSDLLAVFHAGAYGFAMSSNYNGRLRPAEVLVDGETTYLIRHRQTYANLLK
ncbi:diaminopimelate decarboxylase [Candidatus Leptofilum sp.]|uniref:diaminopimelate decarboxylase n=1 Tax=Candidatus Leptofilum sp. TaxID=3241576 RepID=UPI003B5AA36A